MIIFLYNLALLAVLVAGAPWWLWKMATTHKYREGLAERLGRVRPFPCSPRKARDLAPCRLCGRGAGRKPSCWRAGPAFPEFHVADFHDNPYRPRLAKDRFGAERVFYCPLDLPWAVRAYLNALQPRMLILAETEFWPNLLNGCFRRQIPVVVVNARISDRSWPRYRRLRGLAPNSRRHLQGACTE